MSLEKKDPISLAYQLAHNNPEFPSLSEIKKLKPAFTVLDTFAIPGELVENIEIFEKWFEPRFFPLDEEGVKNFNMLCQEALGILKDHSYLLSPRLNEDFPVSKKIENIVKKGFQKKEDILSFFRKVAIERSPKKEKLFFSPERKEKAGAERLSVCRILSLAYVLDHIRTSNDIKLFIEYSQYVLGRARESKFQETGILSTLITDRPIDIISKPNGEKGIMEWIEKGQKIVGCHLNTIGSEKLKRSYYIPEVHIGFKSGLRAFLKVLRSPKDEFQPLTDFLRMRFVFEDSLKKETILHLLRDLQEEAKAKKNPLVEIEFRAKNYFNEEELEKYFPEVLKDSSTDENKKQVRRGSGLDKLHIGQNLSSGRNYRNISAIVRLRDPKNKKILFAFEIQMMTRSELESNEHLERSSSHFLLEMRQFLMVISRLNGKMRKEEIIQALAKYLSQNIKTEQIPERILGEAKYPQQPKGEAKSREFSVKLFGSIQEKAEKIFDFFVTEGTLVPVALNFPSKEPPKRETRMSSGFFIHREIMSNILEVLSYEIKK